MIGAPIPDDERSLVLRAVVKDHRPIFVPDVAGATDLVPELSAEFGEISSWLSVPVARGGFVAAVLCVGWIEPVRRSDDLRIDIVRSLASEASTTIDHTDLLRTLSDNASSDELTGLINRRGWDSLLTAEMDVARRRHTPLSVAILDLDHFKLYNDINGHRAGDRMLREAGRVLDRGAARRRSARALGRRGVHRPAPQLHRHLGARGRRARPLRHSRRSDLLGGNRVLGRDRDGDQPVRADGPGPLRGEDQRP